MDHLSGVLITLFSVLSTAFSPLAGPVPVEVPENPPIEVAAVEVAQVNPELVKLQEFLASKHSPMPAEVLLQVPNWKMIVALSAAESGYCKHMAGRYNCLGIKEFRRGSKNFGGYRNFVSWEEAIQYASELLFKYDQTDGLPEPKAMVARWKYEAPFNYWIANVRGSLSDIDRSMSA